MVFQSLCHAKSSRNAWSWLNTVRQQQQQEEMEKRQLLLNRRRHDPSALEAMGASPKSYNASPSSRRVRFDLSRNVEYRNKHVCLEDLIDARIWYTHDEKEAMKDEFLECTRAITKATSTSSTSTKGKSAAAPVGRKSQKRPDKEMRLLPVFYLFVCMYEICCLPSNKQQMELMKTVRQQLQLLAESHPQSIGMEKWLVPDRKTLRSELVDTVLSLQDRSASFPSKRGMERYIMRRSQNISRPHRLVAQVLAESRAIC